MKFLSLSAIAVLLLSLSSCGILKNPSNLPSNLLRLPGSIIRNTKNLVTENAETPDPTALIALKQTETEK